MIELQSFANRVVFAVRLIPKASRDKIVGEYDGALKLQLTAPPVEGAANAALLKFLAKALGIKNSQVELCAGEKSKNKTIAVSGVSLEVLREKIESLIEEAVR